MSNLTVKTCDGQMVDLSKPENLRRGMVFRAYGRKLVYTETVSPRGVVMRDAARGGTVVDTDWPGYFAGNGDFVGCDPATSERADCERFGIEPSVDAAGHGFARLRDGGALDFRKVGQELPSGAVFTDDSAPNVRHLFRFGGSSLGTVHRLIGLDSRYASEQQMRKLCCGATRDLDVCTLSIDDHEWHANLASGATWKRATDDNGATGLPPEQVTPGGPPPTEADLRAALDVCARALAHQPNTIRAIRQFFDRIAATSVEQLVDSYKSGIYGEEAHTLRNIVLESGDTGLPMPDSPALRSLVKRGLVTAYMPTLLGAVVDKLVYDTQEIPVLGNMPTSFADELLANAESVFGHLWASKRKPSGTKVRIGGKVRDVGPLTPQEAERVLGEVAGANARHLHSAECARTCASGFQWSTDPEAQVEGCPADFAAPEDGDGAVDEAEHRPDPLPEGCGAECPDECCTNFLNATILNPYFCKWAIENLAPLVTWPLLRALLWNMTGQDLGETPDWKAMTAEYDAEHGYPPEPPEPTVKDIVAAAARDVPKDCDAARWRNVIHVIAAHDSEKMRPLAMFAPGKLSGRGSDIRDLLTIEEHIGNARAVMPAYVASRRDGYSAQISVTRLPKTILNELDPLITPGIVAWYCEAYEAG